MKTRLEELDELIAENDKNINAWLWTNHFTSEPSAHVLKQLIDEKVKLEVEKAGILKKL